MFASVLSRTESNPGRKTICKRLSRLRRDRQFVSIRFEGDKSLHQSVILEVNEDVGYLLLDAVFPSDGGVAVRVGQRCVVTAKERGVDAVFSSTVLGFDEAGGERSYRLELPTDIERRERRDAFRVPVSRDAQLSVNLLTGCGRSWELQLRNLSATGICLEIHEPFTEGFAGRLDDSRCELTLDEADPFECILDIRSVRPADDRGRSIVVGARFVNLVRRDCQVLERFLMQESRKLQHRGVLR